eukprot:14270431-Alexandrium_andersonii.AAC.1
MSLRTDSEARCNSISATSSVMPRSRAKRDCSASSGSRTEDAAWEMAAVRYSMKDSTCAL